MNLVVMWCFIADAITTGGLLHLGSHFVSVCCTWAGGGRPLSFKRMNIMLAGQDYGTSQILGAISILITVMKL